MRFFQRKQAYKTNQKKKTSASSLLQPILTLIPEVLMTPEQDKSKFISFELKSRVGQAAGGLTYKKFVRTFEEGTPQEWIELVWNINEIWTQNSINGPTDRTATIRSLLKGESLAAFDTALEDVRVNPDPNLVALVPVNVDHIQKALDAVAETIFPHRALEIQKIWMQREMKKPYEMSARNTINAITKINNSLPMFPLGTQESKFSEQEVIGLIEWSLPFSWRKKFDMDNYIPTQGSKAKLLDKCEAIERNEIRPEKRSDDMNNNNNKNSKFENSRGRDRKSGKKFNRYFFCKRCGRNPTHVTNACGYLKNNTTQRMGSRDDTSEHDQKKFRPFSRRTFRKEVNALARKAGKKKALNLYAAALKREQAKESIKKKEATKNMDSDDSSASSDSMSVNIMEKITPRRDNDKKVIGNGKVVNKEQDKVPDAVNMDVDQEFLEKVAKMNIEDDEDDLLFDEEEEDNDWNGIPI
jgi:hypothetical protein